MSDGTMTTSRVNRIIAAESGKLFPVVERVAGEENRADLREAFSNVAGRFAQGLYTLDEFKGITGELIRDASGTVAGQDRAAAVRESGTRKPWATMPTDGSGRLTRGEGAVVLSLMVMVIVIIGYVVFLMGGAYAPNLDGRAPVPAVTTDTDRDRELIIRGGSMSWEAFTECGNGPAACDAILRELNANPYGVRVFEDGSLIKVERADNTFPVTLSGPVYGN